MDSHRLRSHWLVIEGPDQSINEYQVKRPDSLHDWETRAVILAKQGRGRATNHYRCSQAADGLRCTCQAGLCRRRCKHVDACVEAGLLEESFHG